MPPLKSQSQSESEVTGAAGTDDATRAASGLAPAGLTSTGAAAAPRRIGGGLLDPKMLWKSLPDAVRKLDPRVQVRNPVMFVVEVGSVVTTWFWIRGLLNGSAETRFAGLLVGVIIILVGLTYFPALALGPFAEGLH